MTNPNKNINDFELNEEELFEVNGGTNTSDFSEITLNAWNEMFGQPDGSYRFECPECGAVITDTDLGRFYDAVLAHQETHTQNYGNILNPWNTYWDTRKNIR